MNMELATVDKLIEYLKKASEVGCGEYLVRCNYEYNIVINDSPEVERTIEHDIKTVNIGGWTM